MNKRERLEKCIAGEPLDRVPVTLWRHFPGDDQRAADLARAVTAFQEQFDWDVAIVTPSSQFSVTGYGLTDDWRGHPTGKRKILKRVIQRSLDWTELRVQDPQRGDLGRQLECLNLLSAPLEASNTPFIQVVYSPLTQAARLAGTAQLLRNLRMHPDRVRTGLNTLTESTLRFVEALRRTKIAGIFYAVDLANYHYLTEAEYQTFGTPFDQRILDSLPERWWLNWAHIRGSSPMLRLFGGYRVQVVGWEDHRARSELERAQSYLRGAVSGGLSEMAHLLYGTPATVRDVARQALQRTQGRRFILAAGRPLLATTPLSNIQAVRDIVQTAVG